MHPASHLMPENARKIHSVLLQALSAKGQEPIASHLGVSAATVSRMKNDEGQRHWSDVTFSQVAHLLDSLGLKAVPVGMKCYDPAKIDWAIKGAQEYARTLRSSDDLIWDDEE